MSSGALASGQGWTSTPNYLEKSFYREALSKEKTGTLRVRGGFLRCLASAWSFRVTTGVKTRSPQ